MAGSNKRIEAIAELYESEKYYLNDLDMWTDMIRRNILGINNLSLNRTYSSCSSILAHTTAIYDLHLKIFQKMKEKNALILQQDAGDMYKHAELNDAPLQDSDMFLLRHASIDKSGLEYYSIYSDLLAAFSCYVKYFENLPKAEYYFKKLMFTDTYFEKTVKNYMRDHNMLDLGIDHFIYRPSAKIARYPIFFNAIAKRETDPLKKEGYKSISEGFDKLVKHLEKIFNNRKAQFDTFILSYRFVFGSEVNNKFSLGLIYKKNKLIASRKIIVKKDRLQPASYKDVYLFNRMILICLTAESEFENIVIDDDPIFLSKLYLVKRGLEGFAPNESLEPLYPLFLVQKENRSVKALYFSDEANREIFYKAARQAIKCVKGNIDKSIKIREITRHEEDMVCMCKPESSRNSFISSYGGDDQQDGSDSYDNGEYTEYHINSQGEDDKSQQPYTDIRKESYSGDLSSSKYMSSSKDISSDAKAPTADNGRNATRSDSRSGDRQAVDSGGGTTLDSASMIVEYINAPGTNRNHSGIGPSNIATSDNLIQENVVNKNIQKYASGDYDENSDSLPLQDISDDGTAYFDMDDALNRGPDDRIEYSFDKFGADDDAVSDVSSVCSRTYSDIFPGEEINETFDASDLPSSTEEDTLKNKMGFFSEIFRSAAMPLNEIRIECHYQYERILRNRFMLIYSNKNGIFRILKQEWTQGLGGNIEKASEEVRIHDQPAEKILYDPELELLIFHSGDYAHVSKFHADTVKLEPQRINTAVKGFFYGKFKETAYIALVTNEEYSFSIIHLLKVEYNNELSLLEIKVVRKLYVGFIIFNISFLKGRIIISCKDFEVIEIDTLRTQELLEAYDTSISLLLGSKEHFLARSIFKLDMNTFLLCFNGGGYLIDRTGRYKYSNVSFDWEILGEEFKVFRKWIIVVGQSYITIFEIETGKMIFMEYMPGMKLVEGTQIPLMYCEKSMYLIDFGEVCRDEYEKYKVYSFKNIPGDDESRTGITESREEHSTEKIFKAGIPEVYGPKQDPQKDASIGVAIDSLFFQSFSSQSLRSAPSSNWDSTTIEYNDVDGSQDEAHGNKDSKTHSETTSDGDTASNYHATHRVDMKKFRERYKRYTPSNTSEAGDVYPSSQNEHDSPPMAPQRSFKLEPRGNYKVCVAQFSPSLNVVARARRRKMQTLKRYCEKKGKAWRQKTSKARGEKIDEMDIIGRYED